MKKSFDEFMKDIKQMIKTKNTKVVNEKYVKPAFEQAKEASEKTWEFVEKTTPKVLDASKEAFNKFAGFVNEIKDKNKKQETKEHENKHENKQKEQKLSKNQDHKKFHKKDKNKK